MVKQLSDSRCVNIELSGFETARDLFHIAFRMVDQIDQYHHRLHIGWHVWLFGNLLSQAGLHLLFLDPRLGGEPNPAPHPVLPIDRRVVAKVRKKGAWLQPKYLAQFSAAQPLR